MRNRKYQHNNNAPRMQINPVTWEPRTNSRGIGDSVRFGIIFLCIVVIVALSIIGNPNAAMRMLP